MYVPYIEKVYTSSSIPQNFLKISNLRNLYFFLKTAQEVLVKSRSCNVRKTIRFKIPFMGALR